MDAGEPHTDTPVVYNVKRTQMDIRVSSIFLWWRMMIGKKKKRERGCADYLVWSGETREPDASTLFPSRPSTKIYLLFLLLLLQFIFGGSMLLCVCCSGRRSSSFMIREHSQWKMGTEWRRGEKWANYIFIYCTRHCLYIYVYSSAVFFFLSGVSLLPLGGDLDGFCSPCQS